MPMRPYDVLVQFLGPNATLLDTQRVSINDMQEVLPRLTKLTRPRETQEIKITVYLPNHWQYQSRVNRSQI